MLAGALASAVTQAEARRKAEAARLEANRNLFESYLDGARADRWSGRAGGRSRALAALTKAAELGRELGLPEGRFLELRNEAIALMTLPGLREAKRHLPEAGRPWTATGVDAGLRHYAVSDPRGTISVRRVADNAEVSRWSPRKADPAWVTGFSRDGRRLAAKYHPRHDEGPGQVWLRVWEVGKEKPVLEDQFDLCHRACALSPDGRGLGAGRKDGGVDRWDL